MVVPPRLKVFSDAYVEVGVCVLCRGFVYYIPPVALPIEGAVLFPGGLAVAFLFCGSGLFLLFQYLFVVPLYDSFDVGCYLL